MLRQTFVRSLVAVCGYLPLLASAPAVAREPAGLLEPSFDSGGVSIHYVVKGPTDGEPVVLIHGFAGSIQPQWGPVITGLEKDFKLIALDCRGHGGSGKPHDPKQYGIEMVNDVVRLLDHLKIEKAHIVGYSMGSGIALGFTVLHPERVRTLTLGGGVGIDRGQLQMIEKVADSLDAGKGLGPLIIALTPKDQPPPTPELIAVIDKFALSINDPKALAAVTRSALGSKNLLPTDEQIEKIRVPILLLIGADDPLRAGVEKLRKLQPRATEVVIDNSDHMSAFVRPEFVAALKKFLVEHRESAAN